MLWRVWILTFGSQFLHILVLGNEENIPFNCTSAPDKKAKIHDDIGLRSFLLDRDKHWPNAIVPYEIDPTFSNRQIAMIEEAIKAIEDNSCVRWVPRTNQRDFVRFVHYPTDSVCNSQVGRMGFQQEINLSDVCFNFKKGYRGAILHELMHTLGFIHEQQRLDRDCFVSVTLDGVEKLPGDYAKIPKTSTQFPYDFFSIMHYGTTDYLKVRGTGHDIGNKEGLFTRMDILKLNNMYCGGPTYCENHQVQCKVLEQIQKKCLVSS